MPTAVYDQVRYIILQARLLAPSGVPYPSGHDAGVYVLEYGLRGTSDTTNAALQHAAAALALAVEITWLPTPSLAGERPDSILDRYDALWCSPGSPYQSMEGALQAVGYARRRGRPFVGT